LDTILHLEEVWGMPWAAETAALVTIHTEGTEDTEGITRTEDTIQ
jgi:hypothetical protein